MVGTRAPSLRRLGACCRHRPSGSGEAQSRPAIDLRPARAESPTEVHAAGELAAASIGCAPNRAIEDGAFLALIVAVAASLAVFVLSAGTPRLLAIVPDDAAYFFAIAANASAGLGLTFDGINRTNGFQPLWLALLVPVYAIHRGAPETMLRVFLLLQIGFLTGAMALLHGLVARLYSRHVAFLVALLLVFGVVVPAVNGMESALLAICLALALWYAGRTGIPVRGEPREYFVFGMLLGLVALARLDMVFLVVIAAVVVAAQVRRGTGSRDARRLAGIVTGIALVVGPYLAFNVVSFGRAMPISGTLKSSFPALSPALPAELDRRGWACLLVAAAYLVWFGVRARARAASAERRSFQSLMAIAAGAVVLHFLHTVLFMKWAVFSWHFIPYALFASLIASEILVRAFPAPPSGLRRGAYLLAAGLVVWVGGRVVVRVASAPLERSWGAAAYEAAQWARRATPGDAVFAMSDAGVFGYYSQRRTINLDGIVNSLEYQEVLRDGRLATYLARCGARYVVQHAFWNRPDLVAGAYETLLLAYRSRLYEASDGVRVARGDEVYRAAYFDGPYETAFLIWRLPAD